MGLCLLQWLKSYGDQISELGIFEGKVPNHVLVNEYEPGQGIMVRLREKTNLWVYIYKSTARLL